MQTHKISNDEYEFIFENSTPTIGEILQKQLLSNPCVTFAGYSKPHPQETRMIIKVKTIEKSPKEVMTEAINDLIVTLDKLEVTIKDFEQ